MRAFTFIAVLFLATAAFAAPKFPALTGHVVDNAHILPAGTVQNLDQKLLEYERGTTNQVVVVTLSSLEGDSIEDYGYQLGRYWQIGQKDKNNGVLLIVAPHEHKVRIEVGYGLEPILTDAASSKIVNSVILPDFRAGDMQQGIIDGTDGILSVLGGHGVPLSHAPSVSMQQQETPASPFQMCLIVLCLIGFIWFSIRHPLITWWLLSNSMRFGSSRMDGSGWGGGGGGSFGGGGASGGW